MVAIIRTTRRSIGFGWGLAVAALLLLLAPGISIGAPPDERVPGTIKIHGSPDELEDYVIVEAFPNLHFERPVWIGSPRDGTTNLFVAEQRGVIRMFENKRTTKKLTLSLDLRKKVGRTHNEEGLLGMAFHPRFEKNRQVYLAYSTADPRRTVVSRFEAQGTRKRFRASTEQVILRQRQPYGNHNGGWLAFGPDERLYIGFGDGGSHGDPQDHAQNLRTWLGSILRIDVSGKKGFQVPPENPFVGVKHSRDEIWAYGLQNPRSFSFDRVTGDLWVGDVGNAEWQEINIIECGGNYGWNLREGTQPFQEGRSLLPLNDPLYALGSADARSITGGVVYRGKRLPGLAGAYVYGDLATGNIWALRREGVGVSQNRLIGRGKGITSVGEDADGEIYFTAIDGKIYTLAPWSGHGGKWRFPRLLSQTGLFTDMQALKPHPSLIPYSLNVPFWSDGAHKQRYVMVPGKEKIKVRKDGTFDFPVGTIFVKNFWAGQAERGPLPGTRLETRIFMRRKREWAGYTYVWDADQKDAHLLDGRLEQPRLTAVNGEKVNWTFPSRGDCMSCHTSVGNDVIGFRAEQLDRMHDYGGEKANQIEVFQRLGLFDGDIPKKVEAWPDIRTAPVGNRAAARAYLDVNCAMCHQPEGPGNALIDLRFDTPIKKSNLIGRMPGQWNLGVYGGKLLVPGDPEKSLLYVRMKRNDVKGMPPLAHNVDDEEGLKRIHMWIKRMK